MVNLRAGPIGEFVALGAGDSAKRQFGIPLLPHYYPKTRRTMDIDNPTPLQPVEPDFEFRQSAVRRDEWDLYCKGLKVVRDAFDRLIENPPPSVTLPQVARLLEVVNKIGRIASGLGYDAVEHRVPQDAAFMIEVDAILDRVFAKPPNETEKLPASTPEPQITQPN